MRTHINWINNINIFQVFCVYRASEGLDVSGVKKILTTCELNNDFYELTGCLLYSGRHFFQVLEGTLSDVADLIQLISSDRRQTQMRVLVSYYAPMRSYSKFSMAGLYNPDADIKLENLLILESELAPISQLLALMTGVRLDDLDGSF